MISRLNGRNAEACVLERGHVVRVEVIGPVDGAPYLRTVADGTPSDNLLSLPAF